MGGELHRRLHYTGLTMIAVGACIGSGIFITPAQSLAALPHAGLVLITWFVGGLVSCMGAISFSELGAQFRGTGGVYTYISEAYGDLAGFLYGWIILLIVNTGALAALGMALASFITVYYPLTETGKVAFAMIVIWGLTGINIFGVQVSQIFSQIFTGMKVAAMGIIVMTGIYFIPEMNHEINLNIFNNIPDNFISGMLITFIGVFWSMGGWHHATYLAGEAIEPEKTVPRAMVTGTMLVTFIYISVIASYMMLLPADVIAQSDKVAGEAMGKYLSWGNYFITAVITISIFGTIGIYTMTAPRIYYAMAKDGLFFSFTADVSSTYGTPYKAMLFQAFWASVILIIWKTFSNIITFVTFMDIIFMALATASVFIFRKRKSYTSPFRMILYPAAPITYLLITLSFVGYTLYTLNTASLAGVGILILGIPAYYFFKSRRSSKT